MMNRRTVLATTADPILEHYREWLAARAEWKRVSELPGNEMYDWPENIAAEIREDAALDAMVEMTPITLEGLAALTHVLWHMEVPELEYHLPEYAEQTENPVHKAMLGIWRATTGTAMPLST